MLSTIPPPLTPEQTGALLKRRRNELGLTLEQVAEQAEVPRLNYISLLEGGKVNIAESKYFPAIARILRLTEAQVRQIKPEAFITLSPPLPPPELEVEDRMVRIPLLGSVSAGDEAPVALEREFTGIPERQLTKKQADRRNVFGYIVNGTSMLSDGVRERRSLMPGDTIAVERFRIIRPNDMVVAWDKEHERMLVKLVDEEDDWLVFKSLNSSYAPILRRPDDVHIFGVVIWRGGDA